MVKSAPYQEAQGIMKSIFSLCTQVVAEEKAMALLVLLDEDAELFESSDLGGKMLKALPKDATVKQIQNLDLMLRCVMASNPNYEDGLDLMESIVIGLHDKAKRMKREK